MPLVPHVTPGSVITSTWGNLVADHVIMRFTTAAQRTSQLTAPLAGQLTQLDTTPGVIEVWSGTAWVPTVPPRELAYAQITASKTVTATTESSADAVVQAPAVTFDGTTPVLIEMFSPAVLPFTALGAYVMFWLYQDGVSIGRIGSIFNPTAAQYVQPFYVVRRMIPTAGSHAYTWGATQSGGNGTVAASTGGVGQYLPASLRISRAV